MIHTCVCTGLFPTTGQPLPFLSFGGTNLLFSSAMIGVMLNISKPTSGRTIREPFMNNTVSLNINFMKKPDYARRGA
jgi:cell division protein FtsW